MRFGWFLTVMLILGAIGGHAHAQSFQGGVRGTVKDVSGVLPNAAVMLVNEQTGVTHQTMSNATGEYSFPAIDPGVYKVSAAMTGYRTFERGGVIVNTQQFVLLDLILQVGLIEETITVVGESPFIDRTNA